MIRALSTAATGMEALQTRIDVTAHNLANVNTPGFKRSRAEFEDLMYQTIKAPGTSAASGQEVPSGLQVGLGARAAATARIFSEGDLNQTGNPLDVAIQGDGFLAVQQPSGEIAYTRAGALRTDSQGRLVTADGLPLDPPLAIPTDATSITIASDGTVSVTQAGRADVTEVGKLQVVLVANPAGLRAIGRNLYLPTPASGEPIPGEAGIEGRGTLLQGALEMSNVDVVEEMITLITSQRAYEVNSKVVQAADEMLRHTAGMK